MIHRSRHRHWQRCHDKNGKPYGDIEDYPTPIHFLFAKDYENFRKYIYEGYSLLIKGSVRKQLEECTDLNLKKHFC
jgi:DNA polymerase-3 subunit alpha